MALSVLCFLYNRMVRAPSHVSSSLEFCVMASMPRPCVCVVRVDMYAPVTHEVVNSQNTVEFLFGL
jgi:hypothetical protein